MTALELEKLKAILAAKAQPQPAPIQRQLDTPQDPSLNVPSPPPDFNTPLTPQEEVQFQAWKQQNAPRDSGQDYDLRGAFKAQLSADPNTGHWDDTFKKPNHPTFSTYSQYAQFAPEKAGRWSSDTADATYIPPPGGTMRPSMPPPAAMVGAGPAADASPTPPARVNPDLERAKAALAAAQAPPGKPTWQQQVADKLGGFARYGAMDPVHAQQLEQQRAQTVVENKRNKTQDLVARLKMIQDEDYRQQELERQNRMVDIAARKEAQPDYLMVPPGGTAINKDTGQPAFSSPATAHYEQKMGTIDGKPVTVNYDPAKGKAFDASGQDVTAKFQSKEPTPKSLSPLEVQFKDGKHGTANYDPALGKYHDPTTGADITANVAGKYEKPPDTANQNQQRGDRSFNSRSAELDKVGQPVSDSLQRLGRLFDTIDNGSPLADSVTAPELMVVMAGGAGSGVRITSAEINSIIGSQSKWEQAKAAIRQWSTNPAEANRILEPMRGQIRGLLTKVHEKLAAKEQIIEESRQKLIDSDDPKEHRQIIADTKKAIAAIDEGKSAATAGGGTTEEWERGPDGKLRRKVSGAK